MGNVVVLGAFDLLHWGHLRFLRQAAELGPVTAGLSTDRFLADTKRPPAVGFEDRRRALEELGCLVVPRDIRSAQSVLVEAAARYFVCGSDWIENGHLAAADLSVEFLNLHEIALVYLPREHDMSTSLIRDRVLEGSLP